MLSQLTLFFFLEVSFSVWYRSNGCFFHNVNPTPPPPCVAWKGLPEWAEKRRRAKDSGLFFFFEFQAVLLCYDQQGAAFHHGWFMFWSPPKPFWGACTCVFFKDQILGESGGGDSHPLTRPAGGAPGERSSPPRIVCRFIWTDGNPVTERHRTSRGSSSTLPPTTTTTKTTPSQSRSAFVFASSLSTSDFFFLTKRKKMKKKKKKLEKKGRKKSLVDFVLWLAISQVQS